MRLKRAVYGLRQSPASRNSTIDSELRAKGFIPTVLEGCVYTSGSGDRYIMLTTIVDDLLLTGPSSEIVAEAKNELKASLP